MSDKIEAVLKSGMCAGCGLCASSADEMVIDPAGFLRPSSHSQNAAVGDNCPGARVSHGNPAAPYDLLWGPIRTCEVAYAKEEVVRHNGSSGGVISGILLALLEENLVDHVIQVGASTENPLRNATYVHDTRAEILQSAGSRYAPSAPLAGLRSRLGDGKRYALVGKPCDVAAWRGFLNDRPEFRAQFPYLLSFMCAGVPSEKGTLAVLKNLEVEPEEVESFRYRGNGWPGLTTATQKNGEAKSMTYNESWGKILNKHLQPRCKVCADGIGEAADVVCADAWFESEDGYPSFEEQDGRSLLLARTTEGLELVRRAKAGGYVEAEPLDPSSINDMQPYQLNRKRTAIARSMALRLFGVRPPHFEGYRLATNARNAGLKSNLRALVGAFQRKLKGRF